jgi:hypothetical protein
MWLLTILVMSIYGKPQVINIVDVINATSVSDRRDNCYMNYLPSYKETL